MDFKKYQDAVKLLKNENCSLTKENIEDAIQYLNLFSKEEITFTDFDESKVKKVEAKTAKREENTSTEKLTPRISISDSGVVSAKFVCLEITNSTKHPTYRLNDETKYGKEILNLWKNDKSNFQRVSSKSSGRATWDYRTPTLEGLVTWNSDKTIKDISNLKPLVSKPEKVAVPQILSSIKVFSVKLKKDDPMFMKDPVLSTWRYNPKTFNAMDSDPNATTMRGRIGEIVFHKQYPELTWMNQYGNMSNHYDFINDTTRRTIDVKTINTVKNTLCIDAEKAEDMTKLAHIYTLVLVENRGNELEISCLGFKEKDSFLKFTREYPTSFLNDIGKWKIPQGYLETKVII